MNPDEGVRVALGKIEAYAHRNGLSGAHIEAIFNAGLAAASVLIEDLGGTMRQRVA